MADLKPPVLLSRIANPLAMRIGGSRVATLVVPGRRTGRPTRVPLVPIDFEGSKYLVSARGETEWVRNLRRAAAGELRVGGKSMRFNAEELGAAERLPVLAAYQKAAGKAVSGLFRQLPDPKDHPVFKPSEPSGAGA